MLRRRLQSRSSFAAVPAGTFLPAAFCVTSRRFSAETKQEQYVDAVPFVVGDVSAAGRLSRVVSQRGFQSVLCDTLKHSAETQQSAEFRLAKRIATSSSSPASQRSVLLTGPANTGKRSVMVDLVRAIAAEKSGGNKKEGGGGATTAAIISMRAGKACTMPHGIYANPFLGIKYINATTPFEQLCSAMHRHVRLMRSAYARALPSIQDVDVLGIDSLEDMSPNLFRALDHVAREVRGRPDEPFGGIQLVAAANFWRMSDVDQSSPHGVYIFQTELFLRTFPAERTLLMHRFVHRDSDLSPSTREKLDDYTINALFGNLPTDVADFESLFARKHLPFTLPLQTSTTAATAVSAAAAATASAGGGSAPASHHNEALQTCEFADYGDCVKHMFPAFCRHPAVRTRSYSVSKVHSRFVSWLAQLIYLSSHHVYPLGLPNKLNAKPNSVVMFTRDADGVDADSSSTTASSSSSSPTTTTTTIRRGSLGTVVGVSENTIRVQLWGGERRVVAVRPMRIETQHTTYAACRECIQQFPLLSARQVYPDALVQLNIAPEACVADARYFTEINEFGNFLALLRRPGNVHFTHLRGFLERPACIHEAAKNYYESLIEKHGAASSSSKGASNSFGAMPYRSELDNRLCKNCKKHVPAAQFADHWLQCVQTCRWCSDCSATVPIEKWDAHNEKHTVVMCLDCGRALEWRNWALHRNTCGAMIREVSANNELLPAVTQQTALHMGVDNRDLHSVKAIKKGGLPRTGRDVARGHKTNFVYKAAV